MGTADHPVELIAPLAATVPAALAGRIAARSPRVVVIGDAVLDTWLSGPARRLGRDGPVPVVELVEQTSSPGGAANTAVNLAALGADTELITLFGDDEATATVRAFLRSAGVRTERCVVEPGRRTPIKHRLLAAGQPIARFDVDPQSPPNDHTRLALAHAVTAAIGDGADAVVLADYGLGVVGSAVTAALLAHRAAIALLVVDARAPGQHRVVHPDVVTPNLAEAAALLGRGEPVRDRVEWVLARRADLVRASGGADVLVTLDVDGAVRLPADPTQPAVRTTARPVAPALACGAGDTFTAAYTAAAASHCRPEEALALAQAAADVVVAQPGTTVCTTAALTARLAETDRGTLLSQRELLLVLTEHRRRGHRIVFTNGCFDVLHRGHVGYLRQARALGDVLIVALNSDDSVRRLKGPSRPVNPLEDRASVVGALACVDLVTAFSEDSPVGLIEAVRPDVYAKGGDYTPQMLPEAPVVERLGGQVRVLDYLSDHSTTAIVSRIRERT